MKAGGLLLIVVGVIILCLVVGAAVIEVRPGQGELAFVDGSQAFVYPDAGTMVLVLEQGEFAVDADRGDPRAVQGCYELIGAGLGEIRGRAVWMADVCPQAKEVR